MRIGVLVFVAAFLVAGCASDPSPAQDVEDAGEDIAVTVSATTGAIRGVVVDEAIRPLVNAAVKVNTANGPLTANTTESGAFAFSQLEPGTYFVEASKFGFNGVQQSVDVVAGDAEPPVVRMLLTTNPAEVAYVSAQQASGFILCTTSVVAVCGAPEVVNELIVCDIFQVCLGPLTPDRFGFYLYYEPNATMVQAEMLWDSTQTLSTQLSLSMENIEGCEADSNEYVEGVSGDSPIYNIADQEELERGTIGGECGIWYSVFSGDTAGTPLGVTVQQKFDIYSHAFYGYAPFEGWRLTEHGEPPQPPR